MLIACAMCGEPVLKRRRRHCDACMPKARREHGLRAIEVARKVLAAQAAAGDDPRGHAAQNRLRGEAIAPKLDAFTLAEISEATGLSLAACSRVRVGAKVPHPRHWEAMRALVEG
jgi:hypothetical protein